MNCSSGEGCATTSCSVTTSSKSTNTQGRYFKSIFNYIFIGILAVSLLASCSKEELVEPEILQLQDITYSVCGDDEFTISYYDGDLKEMQVKGCYKVKVRLSPGETAHLDGYSGNSNTFLMAILQNDTTRCHIECGSDQEVSLNWKVIGTQ